MKYIKQYWWIVLVLGLAGYVTYLNFKIKGLNKDRQIQAIELSVLRDSVSIYVDKTGELTYKLNAIEIDNSNLKESLEVAGYNISQLKEKDINWRNIVAALRLQLQVAGTGEIHVTDTLIITKTDTLSYSKFDWSDDYLSFNGSILNNNMKFNYKYQTGLTFLTEEKRNSTIVSVVMTDPSASIISANSIIIKPEKTIWDKWYIWGTAGILTGVLISK